MRDIISVLHSYLEYFLKYQHFMHFFASHQTDVWWTRLWHQLTLAVEELSKSPCFQVNGNHELLDLYKNFVADQAPTAPWTGFASRMNPLKHASLAIVVSKQFGGENLFLAPLALAIFAALKFVDKS